ncbi:hypothetical protein CEXT_667141, partial [Caerostris extrusa]
YISRDTVVSLIKKNQLTSQKKRRRTERVKDISSQGQYQWSPANGSMPYSRGLKSDKNMHGTQ